METIEKKSNDEYEEQAAPGILYQEEDAMLRMIRDYYNESVKEIVIDEPIAFQHALEFFKTHMPAEQKKLQLYLGEKSLFSSYEIEGQMRINKNTDLNIQKDLEH